MKDTIKSGKLFVCFTALLTFSANAQLITQTGSLPQIRTSHSSELLSNGKVLVMGGNDGTFLNLKLYRSAALYNNGTWSSTANMSTERDEVASILLDNGNVLVAGGENDTSELKSCEIYNVSTGTWSATGNMNIKRSGSKLIKLNNGKILAVGGNYQKSCELYDQGTGTWTITGAFNLSRGTSVEATKLPNGDVLLTGSSDSAEIYSAANGTWSRVPAAMKDRSHASAILMSNGKVLIAGGSADYTTEVFDPVTKTITKVGDLNEYASSCKMINLNNGNVLIYGMGDIFSIDRKALQVYNVNSAKWTYAGTVGPSVITGFDYTVNRLPTGKILYAGGMFSTGNGANQYCYLVNEASIINGIETSTENKSTFSCYPSPAQGSLYVQSNINLVGTSYQIYDQAGRLALRGEFSTTDYVINLNDLQSGIYFLQLSVAGGKAFKIMVE
ncbi:MAG: kelch repeat-containing protein [Bacteroidota bacterium]|nr:kelch repeat-containing protein [Bacteroidota bacterium]